MVASLPDPAFAAARVSSEDEAERVAARMIDLARSDFLDALPVAAAVLARHGGTDVMQAANDRFLQLCASGRPAAPDEPLAAIRLLGGLLGGPIADMLDRSQPPREFDWCDGDAVSGRHFVVRLAPLRPLPDYSSRCLLTLVNRTAEVETARSLRAEMLHDSLTGLPNRVAFGEAVDAALAAAGRPVVLMINLRRFSRVNESLGGVTGDELIITVARRLISSIRPGDKLARFGGDEFALLLADMGEQQDAIAAAERLRATMATPFRLSDLDIRVDAAIGCALAGPDDGDGEQLVRNAQFALKCAKSSGRVEVYHPGEARLALRRFSIETDLRRAIEREELSLAFQPIIDLSSNRVSGFEALARWRHPEKGEIGPGEFVHVAEEAGLILPLGRWALAEAARTLAEWDRQAGRALTLSMSVNVSAVQIAQDDVCAAAADALSRHDLPGERLTLELTESVIINDPERATRALSALKELKLRVAMDDFGTGYSSLAYLQRLPIDILKIDRSFVTGMLGDRDSVAIVRAVLSLADALGKDATAEGVERLELAQTLNALGCRYAQGYHFAPALSADAALAYALSRNA